MFNLPDAVAAVALYISQQIGVVGFMPNIVIATPSADQTKVCWVCNATIKGTDSFATCACVTQVK